MGKNRNRIGEDEFEDLDEGLDLGEEKEGTDLGAPVEEVKKEEIKTTAGESIITGAIMPEPIPEVKEEKEEKVEAEVNTAIDSFIDKTTKAMKHIVTGKQIGRAHV